MKTSRSASVIIPTCGRPRQLLRCLDELSTEIARWDGDAEILTVHAPGDGDAEKAVRSAHPDVRIVSSMQRSLSHQRNLGAIQASGKIVIYLDDACCPQEGWFPALLAPFGDPRVAAAAGTVHSTDGSVLRGATAITRHARLVSLKEPEQRATGVRPYLPGANFAIRRRTLFEMGGFDENISFHGEDVELSVRLGAQGHEARFATEATVVDERRATGSRKDDELDSDARAKATNAIYVALLHAEPNQFSRWVPGLIQLSTCLSPLGASLQGKLSPWRALCDVANHLMGIPAGYWKGLFRTPLTPLLPRQLGDRATDRPLEVRMDESPSRSDEELITETRR